MTFPIILAHGVCRFDKIWSDSMNLHNNDDPVLDNLHYFKGIRTLLMSHGFVVFHSNVSWAAGVDRRAEDLRQNITGILKTQGCDKVNIIAHNGSPFADWGTDNLPFVIPVAQKLGIDLNAFRDLRTDRCNEFNTNTEVIEFEQNCEQDILFQTYAGRQNFWSVFDALKLSFYII